jgi:hypothetical protein
MRNRLFALVCVCGAAVDSTPAAAQEPLTLEALLDRMTDLRWLAQPPGAGEAERQFSSYDRATKLEEGRIVNPFANGDRGHYLRVEGDGENKEWVLAEAQGPGYVSRIWSANPAGALRIYIDGSQTPTLSADFDQLTQGKIPPFRAPFGHDAARGRNLYFPFPFARSVKIATTKGDQYYQVNVTTFPAGTKVESYSPGVLERARPKIEAVGRALMNPEAAQKRVTETDIPIDLTIEPGQSESVDYQGPGAITSLHWRVQSPDLEDGLAHVLLTIAFDRPEDAQSATPQVAVPLGDLFGTGPGLNPFQTYVSSAARPGNLTARWYMPFERKATVRLFNQGKQKVSITGHTTVDAAPPARPFLHFHARWRYQDGLKTRRAAGTLDWRALEATSGPGRFVGLLLNVFNPVSAWWGEGDEKVYVDHEPFPSTFGTGTEDYFGYAWGESRLFSQPFHAQTRCDGPASRGNTSVLRYQVLDSIPWARSIAFDLEVWHWEAVEMQFATLAYFYAGPAEVAGGTFPDLSGRLVRKPPPVHVYRAAGVIEGESLKVLAQSDGEVPNQVMIGFGDRWSGGCQLWWVCGTKGATLDLDLPGLEPGEYDVSAAFTRAGDYGIATLALNGQALGDPVDLYAPAPQVLHTGAIELGRVRLGPAPHTLRVTMTGKNPASTSYLFGLDWIRFVPTGPDR